MWYLKPGWLVLWFADSWVRKLDVSFPKFQLLLRRHCQCMKLLLNWRVLQAKSPASACCTPAEPHAQWEWANVHQQLWFSFDFGFFGL